MEELVARCLVEERPRHRYGMHDLVRLYAAGRAREEDSGAERAAAFDRLLEWCRDGVEAAARVLYPENLRLAPGQPRRDFADQRQALDWLDAELPTLVAVAAHAARCRPRPEVWLLADSLRGYFVLRLRIREWISVAESGLRVAEELDDQRAQGAMRHSLGLAYSRCGDSVAAQRHLRRALASHQSAQWPQGCAAVLVCLGGAYFQQGQLGPAVDALEEAAEIAGRHGLAVQETAALGDLGEVCRDLGQFHRARDHQLAAIARCKSLGMSRGEAVALANLGFVRVELGELGLAREHLDEAHRRFAALGSRDGEAYALIGLAAVDRGVGALSEALDLAERAVRDAESVDDSSLVVEALLARAEAARRLGRPAEAAADAERASSLAAAQDYRRGLARACLELGAAELARDRDEPARQHCGRAVRLSREQGYRSTEAHATTLLAELDARAGRAEDAAAHARTALSAHRQTGHRAGEA
ncbi:MAG: tetratricopeptide repeat protein, partial [Micromonosporaceae bacterium]|nr:tetratricopeptide repeat protein [Micromonosporaceae bacterium]